MSGYVVGQVKCVLCGHIWTALQEVKDRNDLMNFSWIECPKCGEFGGHSTDEEDEDDT